MTLCLTCGEAELIVDGLSEFNLDDFFAPKWMKQHQNIEKLNIQAIMSVSTKGDEFIKDYLVNYNKVPILIKDLITTEFWKQFIFPAILKSSCTESVSFVIYMAVYHEAANLNLLETVMYHYDVCEAASSFILDIEDYCYRKIINFINKSFTVCKSDSAKLSWQNNLISQMEEIEFGLFIKCFTILRYLVDHMTELSFSLKTRMLNIHDIPLLMIHFIEHKPWIRGDKGNREIFGQDSSKWKKLEDEKKLSKIEGQIWLSIYQLLMRNECRQKYEINNYRKGIIMKLRNFLTEIIIDQIPILVELKRFVEELTFFNPSTSTAQTSLFIEELPELREYFLKNYNESACHQIGFEQAQKLSELDDSSLKNIAHCWMDSIHVDAIAELEANRCPVCCKEAKKRCSKCHSQWYCSRECQVSHWPSHKKQCS